MSSQGNITIVKGINKSLKSDITFLSSTKARVKMVLNLATSEGWKEKIPKLNHLWAPYTDMPKKRTNIKEIKDILSKNGETKIQLVIKDKNKIAHYSLQNTRKFDLDRFKALNAKEYVEKITV